MAFCFFFLSYFLNNKTFIIFHLPYISLCILCSQNHSKIVPKRLPPTPPFFRTTNSHHFTPINSTSFIFKTTPLYFQNSTETTMKTSQKRCKKTPRRRQRPPSCHLRRRRSSSSPATCHRRLHHAPRRHRLHVSTACALKP